MAIVSQTQNVVNSYDLANWLVLKNNEDSISAKLKYHLGGRVALIGICLFSLTEAIGRVAVGGIGFFVYAITLGQFYQAKNFAMDQLQVASFLVAVTFNCFCATISPKNLLERLPKVDTTSLKLQKQLKRAACQAKNDSDKAFKYLTAPQKFAQHAHSEKVPGYEVGICHFIGRRDEMEDEHLAAHFELKLSDEITYPVQLFGVFDGHGGGAASLYVKKNLESKLKQALFEECSKEGLTDKAIWKALKTTFLRLNREFTQRESGTTATVAMILNGKLWTANVGDARTILDDGTQLTEDAKPTDPYYKKGIEKRGGFVQNKRVNGILAVARAVGDHNVGHAVSARPKITVCPLSKIAKGSHLILTCDGIYDVASTRQVATAVKAHKDQSAVELAKNIVYSAYRAFSTDNLSALVVKL